MTGGRTRPRIEIAMESLISTTLQGQMEARNQGAGWQRIVALCKNVQSLAEIAALIGVPLGVARVIVGDMAEAGLVEIHPSSQLDDQVGTHLLERVLSGLRKL
jgi:hypothetical protein